MSSYSNTEWQAWELSHSEAQFTPGEGTVPEQGDASPGMWHECRRLAVARLRASAELFAGLTGCALSSVWLWGDAFGENGGEAETPLPDVCLRRHQEPGCIGEIGRCFSQHVERAVGLKTSGARCLRGDGGGGLGTRGASFGPQGRRALRREIHEAGHAWITVCARGVFSAWVPLRVAGRCLAVVCCHAPVQAPSQFDAERMLGLLGLVVHDAALTATQELARRQLQTSRATSGSVEQIPCLSCTAGKGLDPPEPRIEVNHPALRRLLDHVRRHYTEPLLLKQLAAEVRLSPTYVSDLFSKRMGVPFKQYLTSLRMRKADGLLRAGTRSVKEIACACGYDSLSPFRSAFKKWCGSAPNRVRRTAPAG